MKKYIFIAIVSLLIPIQALAAGSLAVSPSSHLFDESNLAPGVTITKTLSVTNNYDATKLISFKLTKTSVGDLSDVIYLSVKEGGAIISSPKTLSQIYASGDEFPLSSVVAGQTANYEFTAYLDTSAGNEYQNKNEVFDLNLGFTAENPPISTTTTTSAGTSGVVDRTSSLISSLLGSVGEVLGATASESVTTTTKLGTTTTTVTTEPESIKGATTAGEKACPWWWIIAIILAVILGADGIYLNRNKNENNENPRFWYIYPAVFGALAWIAHYYLHKGYSDTWFCPRYWLVVAAELIIAYIIYIYVLSDEKEE